MKKYERTLQKRRQRKAAIKEIKKHSASIFIILFTVTAIAAAAFGITGKMKAAAKPSCTHEWMVTDNQFPTCDKDGYTTSVCQKCGMERTLVQEMLKHETISRVLGTTENGETIVYVKCTRCGEDNTFYH